ncbi:MAG: Arc family DNA-binding protein [Bacteroidales bacterium]|nr:Arc family DNA-binding protein [Bacteroidota bacterium]MCF8349344.1 Arc family DNA-binding protein [Bacteroidales bacterium]
MSKKKPFVLRVSPEMMSALEKWAQDDFRSVNGQIEFLLNEALKKSGRKKPEDDSTENKTG